MATSRRIGPNRLVNASRRANEVKSGDILVECGSCLKTFKPKSRLNRFCSNRCRMLAWSIRELNKRLKDGTIEGLRDELRKLGESA